MSQNLGTRVFGVWAEQTQESGRNYSPPRDSVFFENGTIYSYGYHFPMGFVLPNGDLVLNADRPPSVTTSRHMSNVRRAANRVAHERGRRVILIPFAALEAAGLWHSRMRIEIVDVEPDRAVRRVRNCPQPDDTCKKHWAHEYHLMGRSVFRVDDRYFLNGLDETGRKPWESYFLTELAEPVRTVQAAIESLKPNAVRDAESQGLPVFRQGEWFFIPAGVTGRRQYTPVNPPFLPNLDGRPGHHEVTAARIDATGRFLVRGTVRHTNREHRTLTLPAGWWVAVRNRQAQSWSGNGGRRFRVD